ncbi:MAG TPA: hypothetical protein VG994_19765 [Steroidobacteraceae bacterium]|nr:hypothetical protein [Steroidobacteraceae bacterium]
MKPLHYEFPFIGWNTDSGVDHSQERRACLQAALNGHASTHGRMSNCIVDKIAECLVKQPAHTVDGRRLDLRAEVDACAVRRREALLDDDLDEAGEIDGCELELGIRGLIRTRQREQLLSRVRESLGAPEHGRQLSASRRVHLVAGHQPELRRDAGERRAQLMRCAFEEAPLRFTRDRTEQLDADRRH